MQTAADFSESGLCDESQENNLNAPKRNIAMQALSTVSLISNLTV